MSLPDPEPERANLQPPTYVPTKPRTTGRKLGRCRRRGPRAPRRGAQPEGALQSVGSNFLSR